MDIEQLKMILEMVKVVSGDATMIAMLYIGLSYLFKFIFLGSVVWVICKISRMVYLSNTEINELSALAKKLNITRYGYTSSYEKLALFKKLNELADKNES